MSYRTITDGRIQCLICPHNCKIAQGRTGICGVRKNTGKEIELTTYGVISGYSLDPVEKKPLYHFFPGHNILSIGSFGCNMRCDFCQNYHISQTVKKGISWGKSPGEIVTAALSAENNIGIAFTYNEPTVWFEYIRDTATAAQKEGLRTVFVSNGYVNSSPLEEIIGFTDAFNIDLKAFSNSLYKMLTGTELDPVKSSLKQIARSGRHLEITSLIIPGHNDKPEDMVSQAEWIAGELGKEVPFHLSRYYPMYKRHDPPTSRATLEKLFDIAAERLDYVYMGNTHAGEAQDTNCPQCKIKVTRRSGYVTEFVSLDREGKCSNCGKLIYRNLTFALQKEH